MGPLTALTAANDRRRAQAAATTTAAVRNALERVGQTAPVKLVAAGELRLAHPHASLAEVGLHARPPLSKDALAGRIRRLLALAEQAP